MTNTLHTDQNIISISQNKQEAQKAIVNLSREYKKIIDSIINDYKEESKKEEENKQKVLYFVDYCRSKGIDYTKSNTPGVFHKDNVVSFADYLKGIKLLM